MEFLRILGHRVFAYKDKLLGTEKPHRAGTATGKAETQEIGRFRSLLFGKLWITLKHEK